MDPYPGNNVPDKAIVHHSAYESAGPQVGLIDQWHEARQFPKSLLGYYVGYHYVIERDGTLTQCRKLTEGGAHAKGANFSSIGICLAGDFDNYDPTHQQMTTLGALLRQLQQTYPAITPESVFPHRHINQTTCYGTRLTDGWCSDVFKYALSPNNTCVCENDLEVTP